MARTRLKTHPLVTRFGNAVSLTFIARHRLSSLMNLDKTIAQAFL